MNPILSHWRFPMLIQVAINNIESTEQGEEILKKWHYHLDEDQSHVVVERDVDGVVVRISGFHPWADEIEEDGEECSCGGDDCCKEGHEHTEGKSCKEGHEHTEGKSCKEGHEHTEDKSCCCQGGDDVAHGEDEDNESDDEGEESEAVSYTH